MSDFGGFGGGHGSTPPPQFPTEPPLLPPASPVPPGAIRQTGLWGAPDPAGPAGLGQGPGYGGQGQPPTPPGRKYPAWVVVVGVIVVLALVGGLVAVLVDNIGDDDGSNTAAAPFERDDPPPDDTTTPDDPSNPPSTDDTTPPADETPLTPEEFQALVDDIEQFVSEERGLPWLRDVTVQLAGEGEFQDRLLADFDQDTAGIELAGQALQAFGLVAPGTDVVEAFRALLGVGVVGFYDPETDELVVRGTAATPYVRTVIAHELTHALDDQHFELDRPALDDAHDESGFGFTALVEGDAVAVETAYRQTLSADELNQATAEEQALGEGFDFTSVPVVLFESLSAPYALGPSLIDDLKESGGLPRLDESFAAPPTTSEQILDPADYIAGEGAVAVPAPTADGPELDRNVLGAFGLAQVLGQAQGLLSGSAQLSDAVEGWGGDAYVLWVDAAGRACVRANIVGDTPEDTQEISEALQDWATDPSTNLETTIVTSDIVTLTSCG